MALIFGGMSVLPAWAGAAPLPEAEQQARLVRFQPALPRRLTMAQSDRALLRHIARDTWTYFRDLVDRETGLVIDNVYVDGSRSRVGSFTSTTNIGLHMMSVVSAVELGFVKDETAETMLSRLLDTVEILEHWEGHCFNFYDTITLAPSRRFVSSVDNGWMAAGLIVARQSFPALAGRIDVLLEQMDFGRLYDPEMGQLYLGHDLVDNRPSPHHYGLLITEPRAASYIAIAKGDLPADHWYRIYRTLPAAWDWQNQIPQGTTRPVNGLDVFYGHYERQGVKYVPSWGGSLFEFLMPTLILDEARLSPRGLGANNRVAVDRHIDYALNEKKYPIWGLSPCAVPNQTEGYQEYGVADLGAKGYPDEGVVTPHVSFLALLVRPEAAIANIRRMARVKGFYGPYGFFDSMDVQSGVVARRVLALDQGMTLVALANYLQDGVIQKRFMSHPLMGAVTHLLEEEDYSLYE